jgi:hypothetical protein
MNPDFLTLEVFDALLKTASFRTLTDYERMSFAGAGPRCLIAEVDNLVILCENGEFGVFGSYDEDGFEPWEVTFDAETGERTELF